MKYAHKEDCLAVEFAVQYAFDQLKDSKPIPSESVMKTLLEQARALERTVWIAVGEIQFQAFRPLIFTLVETVTYDAIRAYQQGCYEGSQAEFKVHQATMGEWYGALFRGDLQANPALKAAQKSVEGSEKSG